MATPPLESNKVVCPECGWRGMAEEILVAPNPFESGYNLNGCPQCKDVNTTRLVCDEPGCLKEYSCGWPDGEGVYRLTCGDHYRSLAP